MNFPSSPCYHPRRGPSRAGGGGGGDGASWKPQWDEQDPWLLSYDHISHFYSTTWRSENKNHLCKLLQCTACFNFFDVVFWVAAKGHKAQLVEILILIASSCHGRSPTGGPSRVTFTVVSGGCC